MVVWRYQINNSDVTISEQRQSLKFGLAALWIRNEVWVITMLKLQHKESVGASDRRWDSRSKRPRGLRVVFQKSACDGWPCRQCWSCQARYRWDPRYLNRQLQRCRQGNPSRAQTSIELQGRYLLLLGLIDNPWCPNIFLVLLCRHYGDPHLVSYTTSTPTSTKPDLQWSSLISYHVSRADLFLCRCLLESHTR